MNKHDFKINYDFRPYLPDIYIKQNIYNSCDKVNNNINTDINTMIFIVNINRTICSQYNDPNYILFGIKNQYASETYGFPSLNFFSPNTDEFTYKITETRNILTDETKNILNSIGYDLLNIDENEFIFNKLLINENITSIKYNILYFYFNLKKYDSEQVNYNKYNTSIYYNNLTHNVLIYPYYNNTLIKYDTVKIKTYNRTTEKPQHDPIKTILNIDFDDREIIKYFEKIDYKYFENTNFTMNEKNNMETYKNYSQNIKNYIKYIQKEILNNEIQTINIDLNEISKLFYYSTDYNLKNPDTLTLTHLNNQHINKNNSYSNQANRYSYTTDSKMSNINNVDSNTKKYSMYYYTTNTFEPTLYQQTSNYYLNFYYNISDTNAQNQMSKLNILLHKILVFINPKIIDLNYLLKNVNASITPLFDKSNNLKFGKNDEKLYLYILGEIIQTKIYYINKYKIIFEFIDIITKLTFNYIIILNIVFYDKSYFDILDINNTTNTPLAYTNYSVIEESVSLLPSIYSIYKTNLHDDIFFYNNLDTVNNGNNLKNYYWNINYSGIKINKTSNEFISMYNFYEIIPNIFTNLKTTKDQYYNNLINVLKNKVNNYIINFLNVEQNYVIYTNYINTIKKYINNTTLYDETIITNSTTIKYIEYYNYFPKISTDYLSLTKNFMGKYYQVLQYPQYPQDKTSLEILPSGKYIKFNYINYSSLYYPSDPELIETFVKSIKTIDTMKNYYFSLFIMMPFNINQDNEFQTVLDNNFPNQTTYSMDIGGNKTCIYLVLTDENANPYNFYSENETNDGIIFGIKLYNYNNFISSNLKLKIILNLYMTQYINLNEFVILMENFSDYTDANNVLWDINNSYLKLHNFDSLKEIILYDYKRFKPQQNIDDTKEQYMKFNYKTLQILYENKVQLNYLRYDIKIFVYISNLYKIIKLLQKMYSYYEIVRINIMYGHYDNKYIINLIKYNSKIISDLMEINYNLSITSGNFETKIYMQISQMCKIDSNTTLSEIVQSQSYCIYIIDYSLNKMPSISNLIISNVSEINNLYHNLYYQIFEQMIFENINFMIQEQIIYDIDNFTDNTNINVFDGIFNNLDIRKKKLFLKQINAYLKSIAYNSTKIDELYNLAKLMKDFELNNIVKNDYIYDTITYTAKTNIPKFKIISFLENTIDLINKESLPSNNIDYEIYQKAISQGIITFILNTIQYFNDIIDKIIKIYIYLKELPGIGINIYEPIEIGKFYHLLELFFYNYNEFFNILFKNKINKFYEYSNLKIMFDNLFYSCEEFLFYICLKNDFINDNTLFISENVFINEDLYKIIKTDVFIDFAIKTILNIDDLIIKKNHQLTKLYLEKIKSILENKIKNYINDETIKIIEQSIFNSSYDFIDFGSYYIVPYQDLLMFKGEFTWASFNFKHTVANVIKNINLLNLSIFTFYYTNQEITDFYKQALNYAYLETPYNYININNNNNIPL